VPGDEQDQDYEDERESVAGDPGQDEDADLHFASAVLDGGDELPEDGSFFLQRWGWRLVADAGRPGALRGGAELFRERGDGARLWPWLIRSDLLFQGRDVPEPLFR
jgi:hypothetical protein